MIPKIICTTSAKHIGKKLDKSGCKVIFLLKNKDGKNFFPDGETYVALNGIKKNENRCVVIHSGSPNPDKGLTELRIILENLKNLKVKSIKLFFTYFPYSMQDSIFDKGEINVAECLIKELLNYYGVKKIYVIDAHFYKKPWTKNYPIVNISVFNELATRARQDFPDMVFLSPDEGAIKRNGIVGAKKKRVNSYEVRMRGGNVLRKLVKDKNIGVVDDILETGGTLDLFYDECKALGAKKIVALVTHGVLKRGIDRIQKKYSKLYLTNSINQKIFSVDVSSAINKMKELKF